LKSVGTILVLIFSTLLALIVAAITCMILFELLPDPIYAVVIAAAVFVLGFGIAVKWTLRYGRSSDRYTHCPACAFDVRAVGPDAGGTIRCPSCGQWLSGPAARPAPPTSQVATAPVLSSVVPSVLPSVSPSVSPPVSPPTGPVG
jgi:ribosomal protein L37AE/L43A